MDKLQQSLREISSKYRLSRLPVLTQSLQGTLDNVRSFTSAVSSADQYTPIACLIWSGIQAVIKYAYKVSDILKETISLLSNLNSALPRMGEYIKLFPENPELQWPLQDLYDNYLDYYIIVVHYLRNRPSRTKAKIAQHIKEFETEVKLLDRKTVKKQNIKENIPFEYGKYYHIMGFVRLWQRKREEAVQFVRRGADLFQMAAGVGHPMTQLWRFGLGCISYHVGELQRAWEIMEDIRKDRIQICGEYNYYTLESYSTCGALLMRLDRLEEAEQLLKQCLERRKRYAWNPEEVARAQFRLSQALKQLNKEDEAEPYAKEATRARENFLKRYADQLKDDPDEEVVFDQMVSLWAGRFTGKLRDGISNGSAS